MFVFQSGQQFQPSVKEMPGTKFTMKQLVSAVWHAGSETEKWLYSRMEEYVKKEMEKFPILDKTKDFTNVYFGPAAYCYRYRVSVPSDSYYVGDGMGARTREELANEMKRAAGHGIPIAAADAALAKKLGVQFSADKEASDEECRAVFLIHCLARLRDGADHGRKYVVKHLFEQNAEFENSEKSQIRYKTSLSELRNGAARPFLSLMSLKNQPIGFMAGHAYYPVAEKELRAKYPSIISVIPPSASAPVSLSPYFLRGFVRKDMKYEGLIITDDIRMGGVTEYLADIRQSLPKGMRTLSDPVLFFVLATYAGANLPLNAQGFSPDEKKEVLGLYNSNLQFRKVFDEMALESLFLHLRAINPKNPLISGISLPDLSAKQDLLPPDKRKKILELNSVFMQGTASDFDAKFMILVARRLVKNERRASPYLPQGLPKPVIECVEFFSNMDECWSRNGIIDMFFRQKVVASLTGKTFPGPEKFKYEAEWLDALMHDKVFSAAYNQVDWNGAVMRTIFERYSKETASENSEKGYGSIKSLVPVKKK